MQTHWPMVYTHFAMYTISTTVLQPSSKVSLSGIKVSSPSMRTSQTLQLDVTLLSAAKVTQTTPHLYNVAVLHYTHNPQRTDIES